MRALQHPGQQRSRNIAAGLVADPVAVLGDPQPVQTAEVVVEGAVPVGAFGTGVIQHIPPQPSHERGQLPGGQFGLRAVAAASGTHRQPQSPHAQDVLGPIVTDVHVGELADRTRIAEVVGRFDRCEFRRGPGHRCQTPGNKSDHHQNSTYPHRRIPNRTELLSNPTLSADTKPPYPDPNWCRPDANTCPGCSSGGSVIGAV